MGYANLTVLLEEYRERPIKNLDVDENLRTQC